MKKRNSNKNEIERIRDAALLRALKTPHQPHEPLGKKKRKSRKKKPGK